MIDKEKVLTGLECCRMNGKGCRQCLYNKDCDEMPDYGNAYLCSDALELLKEQQETIVSLQSTINKLTNEKAEVLKRFNMVDRVLADLGLQNAYDMPSFWCNNGKDYKVIPTQYHKGYMQALEDVERDIRLQFGFAERDDVLGSYYPARDFRTDGERHEGR